MSNRDDPGYVGKGRPPRHRQFPKGMSGNPKGRPKKMRPGQVPPPHVPFANQMILESAFEPIGVRRPDGSIGNVTSTEAVLYAVKAKALGGNSHAQKTYLDFVRSAERTRLEAHAKLIGSLVAFKVERQIELDKWLGQGRSELEFPFHPEDVNIDAETGEVSFDAPFGRDEEEARNCLVDFRDRLGAVLDPFSKIFRLMEIDGGYTNKLAELSELYDDANDLLPPRFRKPRPG